MLESCSPGAAASCAGLSGLAWGWRRWFDLGIGSDGFFDYSGYAWFEGSLHVALQDITQSLQALSVPVPLRGARISLIVFLK